ncbi:putative pyridoxal-phosphate dependent protein [Gordonia polyisoprenivorans VH2]|uniref:L-cysteine desulfhydrase Cds1 n=1 Tax=Gordonia polyisoprenivorans (strain DSM 44266 / VH2) TaxID=1112204 RepID=H6N1D1_GORPV|nr:MULTISPECIES: PLP-dependent cysteine synthase family protein [Gordonia]AFA72142.1 putative pyridoxal-phosphate dependent protein [Gordonia polyisoprenivorans VH2]MDF3284009.1 PLP-dependent cysteine synthase family protein [Gordonia sp. N1V]OPX16663.1 cysteine synthase [Gordonia sp. i37]OZC33983.1 cysteine synthase [Gordonia polyisoprenivorans]
MSPARTIDIDRRADRSWADNAVRLIEADARRSADTHLLRVELPDWSRWTDADGTPGGVDLYLKDESTHPTGSLKHRLARSLFLYAICNGWITEGTTVIEASSGSTAVSEAYFAHLIGVPFLAVMTSSTSPAKTSLIEREGGRCHFVERPAQVYAEALRLEAELGGHFIDQFTMAERATDWRGNNNIAESIFAQMADEEYPIPTWIVVGAGTGGTSATLGRYLRYRRHPTWLAVVDPENSVFLPAYESGDGTLTSEIGSRIEGIGRPRVEPSFVSQVIDRMIGVPDTASIATARCVSERLGRRVGGSTGTNMWGALKLVSEMVGGRQSGSVVTLLCDPGERYSTTYFDDDWLAAQQLDLTAPTSVLDEFFATGRFTG